MTAVADSDAATGADSDSRLSPGERRAARIGTTVAVLAFWLLATLGQPWHLFDRTPFTADFYDVQARALVHGHLDIPSSVAGIEGFVVHGKTYIYFGIGPALLRLPFTGWTDALDSRLSLLSQMIAVAVLGLAAARLLKRARLLVADAPRGSPWWYAVMAAGATLCTPLLYLSARSLVYHEAELWGVAAGVAGLDLVLRWWRTPTRRHLVEAVALATFAMACRPSTGMAPAFALGLFGLVVLWRRQWTRGLTVIGCSVIPLAGFGIVNWLRFGSFFDVPFPAQVFSEFNANRQAALAANHDSLFGLKFVPTTLVQYLSPFALRLQRLFPFVGWGPPAHVIGDATFDTIDHSGSITTGAPALFVLALIGAGWTVLRDRTRQWSVLAVAAVVATASAVTFGYIAHRYLADLVPVVLVLAIPGVWVLARWLAAGSVVRRRLVVGALSVLAVLGTWGQAGLALQSRLFSYAPTQSEMRGFVEFQYGFDDALFGGAPPQVVHVDGGSLPAGVDGQVAILGDCRGLYRYDGYSWSAVERAAGSGLSRLVLTGPVDDAARTLVTGDGWMIAVERTASGVVATYHLDGGDPVTSSTVDVPDGDVTFDVVADPANNLVVLSADGRSMLGLPFQPAEGMTAGAGWSSTDEPATFCSSLLDRVR